MSGHVDSSASSASAGSESVPERNWGLGYEVVVEGVFGDEASDADLAEVIKEVADLIGGPVEIVGVFVEHREEQVFAALAVAPLPADAFGAGDLLDDFFGWCGVIDADLAKPFVDGLELVLAAEHQGVEVIERASQALDVAVVSGWGQQEPQHGEVERHGVDGEFLDVELSSPVSIPGPFQCGDGGLRGSSTEKSL